MVTHARDAQAVAELIDEHYGAMHRLARLVGRDLENARHAVRAAWLAFLEGADSQASVRARLLQLVLQAVAAPEPPAEPQPVASPDDFEDPDGRWAGWWKDEQAATPRPDPERLDRILAAMPAGLTALLVLRDVEQLNPDEVETLLGHTPEQQLRLLHYARTAVRNALRAGENT